MTSSIKPPGGPGALDSGPSPLTESAPAAGADRISATPETTSAHTAASAAEQAAPSGAAGWLQRFESGEISREVAIDGIVSQAMRTHETGALSAAQRLELETVLRDALANDPTLSALFTGG